jgi:long-chain acyl-CoA synthetase
MPIVTSYATLGEEGLEMSLTQTKAKAIFVDPNLIKNLSNPLQKATDIKFVVYNSNQDVKQAEIEKFKVEHEHITILSYHELLRLGQENPVKPVQPQREDLCCIMYTSGTTGARTYIFRFYVAQSKGSSSGNS